MTRSGSTLVLAGLALAAGCAQKRPHGILVSTPPALQTVLAIDKDGNQILAGSFTGRVIVAGTQLASQGGRDIFVVKTDKAGTALFAPKQFGGKDDDFATGLTVDKDGNILVAGTFQSTARFGDKTISVMGDRPEIRQVFVAKLDSKGDVLWVKRAGSVYPLTQISVAIAPDGSVVVGSSGPARVRGTAASPKAGAAAQAAGKVAAAAQAVDGSGEVVGESQTMTSLSAETGEPIPQQPMGVMSMTGPFGCDHDLCHADWSSPPLVAGCGMYGCTAAICLTYHDPYCCSTHWDPICVGEVFSICHRRCDCADICAKGEPFYPDACDNARNVINTDPECANYWGSHCVSLAGCH